MTYLVKRRPMMRRRPQRPGMGDWMDDLLNKVTGQPSGEQQCVDSANQQEAAFDAKVDDLVKNWNPTGFYAPADIRTLVSATMALVTQSQGVLDQVGTSASVDSIIRATDDLTRAGARSLDYLAAATQADQQGITVVNAPGLKKWITNTMGSCGSAVVTANAISCLQPWWVAALAAFQSAFDVTWAAVKGVVGTVAALGAQVLKVAADLPELSTYIEIGAIALGAWWLWNTYGRGRR